MFFRWFVNAAILLPAFLLAYPTWAPAQEPQALNVKAPEITGIQEWINSKPVKIEDLRGKVVVLHFWTFG